MESIIVASGKGGVGKTTIATAIARSISLRGIRTGLIDLDVDSPSVPMITGTSGDDIGIGGSLLEPAITNGLKVFSIGHLLPSEDTPILWEGSRKERVLMDIFKSCDFRDVECLVIDLPPGTGDELYGVTTVLQSATAIVVTLPQQLSLISVKKALKTLERYNIQILGIVENMSGFKCPKCSAMVYPFKHGTGKKLADTYGVEFLGAIPIMMNVSSEADNGSVETIVNSAEFKSITDKIMKKVGLIPESFIEEVKRDEKEEKSETEAEKRTEKSGAEGGGSATVKEKVEDGVEKKKKGVGRITATIKEKRGKGKKGEKKGDEKNKVKVKKEHIEEVKEEKMNEKRGEG